MAQAARQEQDSTQGIEYSILVLEDGKWNKTGVAPEMQDALNQAEKLFKSGKYKKVEVKQKYFDKKKNRNIDVTLRVFELKKKGEISLVVIFLLAIICGAAAFGLTYFLTK